MTVIGFSPAANPKAMRSASTGTAEVRGSARISRAMEAVAATMPSFNGPLSEGQKPVAAVYDIRQHDQSAERDAGIELVGGHSMLLAAVCTDEQLHATTDEVRITRVSKVLDPFVDAIQIHVSPLA
jgi:hypothetical protein